MNKRGVFEWLTVDMILFVALNVGIIFYFRDFLPRLYAVGYFQLIVLGLAAFRVANIVSTELIAKPLRAPFVDEVEKEGRVVEKPKKSGFLGATGLLIHCPSCTGVWISAAFVYLYLFWPIETFTIAFIFALSGIERVLSNSLGWFRHNS